jgi:phenylalanyl-tRNA synthetase beta chain
MKLSLNWLKDYVPVKCSAEKLTDALTMIGVEVEHVDQTADDTIFTVEITPNRHDCLNLLGLAREVAAALDVKTASLRRQKKLRPKQKIDITIQDKKDCSRYIGVLIEGVKVTPSPTLIAKKLTALGARPANNVVDITNFTLMENGQPLHAFDYDKLKGGKIIVRRAKAGERMVTIDGVERTLDPSILVIADAKRPVAIAGIMGGKETEVSNATKIILLESAYFDPILVRRASRKLALSSDASYRFERGVVFETVEDGADRAVALILEHAGGQATKRTDCLAAKKNFKVPHIKTSVDQINRFLGSDLSLQECKKALSVLGFEPRSQGKTLTVIPPFFRPDVTAFVDVAEEIARVVGFNNIPGSLPRVCMVNVRPDEKLRKRQQIKEALLAQGFDETISFTMISRKELENAAQGQLPVLPVKNPLSKDQEIMRPSLLPSALTVAKTNLHCGEKDFRFFEMGKIYQQDGERETLSVILTGKRSQDWREATKNRIDFFDAKAAVESAMSAVGIYDARFVSVSESFFEEVQAAHIVINNEIVGSVGRIRADVLAAWEIKVKDIYFADLNLERLYREKRTPLKYKPLIEFPAIVRDISLAINKNVLFDQVKDIAFREGGSILKKVDLVEEYRGEKIASGQRGLVLSLTYQSFERTLREEEVNAVHEKIVAAYLSRLNATRR